MPDTSTGQDMRDAESRDRVPDIVIITGMSGSGRTQALHCFEDMGYFCIDNLPPRLVPQLAELVGINSGVGRHLAVTCDLRSQGLFDELTDTIRQLLSLGGGTASLNEILLPESFIYAGKAIMDIPIPGDTILVSITRDTEFIIPHGSTVLLPWDHILCLTRDDSLHQLTEAWGLSGK